MEIKNNRIIENKTYLYLTPVISYYGKDLSIRLGKIFKHAIGIGDSIMPLNYVSNNTIFILFKTDLVNVIMHDFIIWFRKQSYYVTDYAFDNIKTGNKHMIVLKIPNKYYQTMTNFKLGKYSGMYNQSEIKKFFKINSNTFNVLTREKETLKKYVDEINREWDTNFEYEEWDAEIDHPPVSKEEVFNYEQ